MAATLVGSETLTYADTSITLTLPTGIEDGDVGVLGLIYYTTGATPPAPSGWTEVNTHALSGSVSMVAWQRTMAASDSGGSVTLATGVSQKLAAAVAVLRGVTYDDLGVTSGADTCPSVSVSTDTVAVTIWTERGGTVPTSLTPPSGFTHGAGSPQFGSGGGQTSIGLAHNLTPNASTVGGGAWTPSTANSVTGVYTFALTVTPDPPNPTTRVVHWDGITATELKTMHWDGSAATELQWGYSPPEALGGQIPQTIPFPIGA